MPEPRHPYRFSPWQERLTAVLMVHLILIFVTNVFFKVTSAYIMVPMIALAVVLYIASLIAGRMKK